MPDKFRVKADNKLIDGTTQSGHWSKERHREKGDATEITSILLFNTSHVKGSLTELFFSYFSSTIPGPTKQIRNPNADINGEGSFYDKQRKRYQPEHSIVMFSSGGLANLLANLPDEPLKPYLGRGNPK